MLTPFLFQSHLLKELRSAPLMFLSFVGFVGVAVPFMLVSYGEQYVDSSLAGLLMAIGPLATLIGAHYITRDELITRQRLGNPAWLCRCCSLALAGKSAYRANRCAGSAGDTGRRARLCQLQSDDTAY